MKSAASPLFATHFFAVDPLNIPAVRRILSGIAAGVIIGVVCVRVR
jgi:hypothetical protein